jgi:hypothetical protein
VFDVDPTTALAEPEEQRVHDDDDGAELYEPAKHVMHVVEPAVLYVPAGQTTQLLLLVEPVTLLKDPVEHGVHWDADGALL